MARNPLARTADSAATAPGPRSAARLARTDAVAVIGLGRFGRALALELVAAGVDVLGIDDDEDLVQSLHGRLTHVVRADCTREDAMRQLAVPDFDTVVVGIGSNLEASILTASLVVGFGVDDIWAKATSEAHARILSQLGVHHVVRPENDMGRRVAHLVHGAMKDYIDFEGDFAMVTIGPPAELLGRPLGQTGLRKRHGVTIVAVRVGGEAWTHATAETVLEAGDTVIAAGSVKATERFSRLARA